MASEFEYERLSGCTSGDKSTSSMPHEHSEVKSLCNVEGCSAFIAEADESVVDGSVVDGKDMDCCSSKQFPMKFSPSPHVEEKHDAKEESEDIELGGFFLEDAPSNDGLPPEIVKLQKQEKMRKLHHETNLVKLDGIWKKVICWNGVWKSSNDG